MTDHQIDILFNRMTPADVEKVLQRCIAELPLPDAIRAITAAFDPGELAEFAAQLAD